MCFAFGWFEGFFPFFKKKSLFVQEPLIHIQYNIALHVDLDVLS